MTLSHFAPPLHRPYIPERVAMIGGQPLPYYCCSTRRNSYRKMEKAGTVTYIGRGTIYSIEGKVQKQPQKGRWCRVHFWAKTEPKSSEKPF